MSSNAPTGSVLAVTTTLYAENPGASMDNKSVLLVAAADIRVSQISANLSSDV